MPDPLVVDHVIVVCKSCPRERTIWPDAPLVGAQKVHEFIQRGIAPCGCGGTLCDLKLHIMEPKEPAQE